MSTEKLKDRIDSFCENLINMVNENQLDQKINCIISPTVIGDSDQFGGKILYLDSLITSKYFFKMWMYRNIQTEDQLLEIERQIFKRV